MKNEIRKHKTNILPVLNYATHLKNTHSFNHLTSHFPGLSGLVIINEQRSPRLHAGNVFLQTPNAIAPCTSRPILTLT